MPGACRHSRAGWRGPIRRSNGPSTKRRPGCPGCLPQDRSFSVPALRNCPPKSRCVCSAGRSRRWETRARSNSASSKPHRARRRDGPKRPLRALPPHPCGRPGDAGAAKSRSSGRHRGVRAQNRAKVRSPSPGRMTHIRPIPLAEGAREPILSHGGTRDGRDSLKCRQQTAGRQPGARQGRFKDLG